MISTHDPDMREIPVSDGGSYYVFTSPPVEVRFGDSEKVVFGPDGLVVDPQHPSSVAEVFADRDYKGASLALEVGQYVLENSAQGAAVNDAISSIKVTSGYRVRVYANSDFSGDSSAFTADAPYIGDKYNDAISALQVEPVSG